MHGLKNGILGIGLAAVCGYSLFQKLQWSAVLSLALLIGLLYRRYTLDLIEGCLAFLHSARVAEAISPKIESVNTATASEVHQATPVAPKKDRPWFEREVAVVKAELEKLPADRQKQVKRELEKDTEEQRSLSSAPR
jgi:hypothetical protein